MTPYLFWELLFLGVGVWVLALILVVYAWILLQRQKRLIEEVMEKLDGKTDTILPTKVTSFGAENEKKIAISKDEPIGKYANMTGSETVDVSFVEARHNENKE